MGVAAGVEDLLMVLASTGNEWVGYLGHMGSMVGRRIRAGYRGGWAR
jgi:hypothetical protein